MYRNVELNNVKINDKFWRGILDRTESVTVPDVLKKLLGDGVLNNYRRIIEGETGKHDGPPWSDGMFYEVMCGVSGLLSDGYDKKLDEALDEYAAIIEKAQLVNDGYICTNTSLLMPKQRFGENGGKIYWQHDLFNMGCLFEAGVARYKTSGKTGLLAAAVRAANVCASYIGEAPKHNIVPGHSIAEDAVLKMYELFRDEPSLITVMEREYNLSVKPEEYLELGRFWVENRGVCETRTAFPKCMLEYAQDHRPMMEQTEAVGHAVRAVLLYTGLTRLALDTGERKYFDVAKRLWKNVVETKMYVSGALGVTKEEEKFGFSYQLPSNGYMETCAGVVFAFWAGTMHAYEHDASYYDVFERVIYNNVLDCVAESGDKYFYVNPLYSDGSVERWNWHSCPCCPPMFLKTMGALKGYIYGIDGDDLYVNLLYRSEACLDGVRITQEEGRIAVESDRPVTVHVRIPEYLDFHGVKVDGIETDPAISRGYVRVSVSGKAVIEPEFSARVKKVYAHPYVNEIFNKVAVTYGPFLYAYEADDKAEVDLTLGENTEFTVSGDEIYCKTNVGKPIKLIPYYRWNNHGPKAMTVWFRQEGLKNDKLNLDGWDGKLYREWKSPR